MAPEPARDNRPFVALAAVVALLALLVLVPATRAWLDREVLLSLHAQADPSRSATPGYSLASLAFWSALGGVLAWTGYELVFRRLGYEPDRRFFLALAPFLVAGPLAHALLSNAVFAPRSVLAYAATEPTIYLTIAILVVGALALGRAARQPLYVPLGVGLALVAALLVPAASLLAAAASLPRVGIILLLAALPTAALAWGYHRWRAREPLSAVVAVVGAHALDGATTWMVLRDPFGLGFVGYAEKNPVSRILVEASNGWPYFAVKLALPLVLLSLIKPEEGGERTKAFLLFAIFVLGYGPGMSNLLQVLLG